MLQERDDAAESLRQVQECRQAVQRRTQMNDRLVYLVLAAAYFIGFGGQYTVVRLAPGSAAKSGVVVAVVGSLGLFAVLTHSYNKYNGVGGEASKKPGYLGRAWLLGLVATLGATTLISALVPGVEVMHVAYTASSVLIGLIYSIGGIFFADRRELFLGFWLIGIGVVCGIIGMPLTLLVLGILPSVGFLACVVSALSTVKRKT